MLVNEQKKYRKLETLRDYDRHTKKRRRRRENHNNEAKNICDMFSFAYFLHVGIMTTLQIVMYAETKR